MTPEIEAFPSPDSQPDWTDDQPYETPSQSSSFADWLYRVNENAGVTSGGVMVDPTAQSYVGPTAQSYVDWSYLYTSPWQVSLPPSGQTPPYIPRPAPAPTSIPTMIPPRTTTYAPTSQPINPMVIVGIGVAAIALFFILKRK